MSTSSINPLSSLENIVQSVFQKAGITPGTGGSSAAGSVQPSDGAQLSPFAQIASELQQLQQSDPAKYKQVTSQIATNLQSAAQTAQTGGQSSAANILNQLATDFNSASQNGQAPIFQNLAQAAGGHHHHHHHGGPPPDSSSTSSSQTASTDPLQIIENTLAQNGI